MINLLMYIFVCLSLLMSCSLNSLVGGSGSETTNGITGVVLQQDGTPAVGATVRLRRQKYLAPLSQSEGMIKYIDKKDTVTDNLGRFVIDSVDTGEYFIEVVDNASKAVVFPVQYNDLDSSLDLGVDTLHSLATIAGFVNFAGDTSSGIVRIFGLERQAAIDDSGYYSIAAPAGQTFTLKVTSEFSKTKILLDEELDPGEVEAVSYDFHTYLSDSIEVRSFLNNMGLTNIIWDDIITVEFGGIEEMDLSDLGITQVHHSIGDLDFLSALFLDENPLTELTEELLELEDLCELSLGSVPLEELPFFITKMISLEILNLSNTRISELPEEFTRLENLEELILVENRFTEFPEVILACSELITLDLSDNAISALPPEINELESLVELLLHANALAALPPQIGDLIYLEELSVNENQLAYIPDEIGELANLLVLLLANNNLKTLPMSITDLTPSEELDVSGNPFMGLPQEIQDWIDLWSY